MNTYKNLASIAILSVVLVAPILALASTDSAGPGAMVLPGNLPCQAEFKAYNAKYPPQLPSGMPKPGSGGVPLPSISTTSMAGAVPTGMGDINKDSNMNSAEGKALQDCLAKNAPKVGTMNAIALPGNHPGGAMGGSDSSTSGASTSANGCPILTRTLARGSRGGEVTTLQTYLISQNLLTGPTSGYFGGMTVGAVKSWQTSHSISPTGVVGPKTRAALANCQGE